MPRNERILVFVGENRSQTAQEKGYSWQWCQRNRPVLSAIRLWDALATNGLDPKIQTFFNLWRDDNEINRVVVAILREMAQDGETIIGMGNKVSDGLKKLNIPHKKIIHPAALGKIASKRRYRSYVKKVLDD